MDDKGWVDIAYSMGVCNHGYVLAGRGARRRTAANGTDEGNQHFYAVVWLGGGNQQPSKAALDAIDWCVEELRATGGAGNRVLPHSHFRDTGCPGDHLRQRAAQIDGKPVSSSAPKPPAPKPPAPKPLVVKPPAPKPLVVKIPPYPGVTRQGMRNSSVTWAYQQRLKDRGWRIVVDGDHSDRTTKVLKAFQDEKGLVVDGIGGPATWRALWTAPVN